MVLFTFSVSDQKYTFWINLVQKIKIVSLRLNFLTKIIAICNGAVNFFRSQPASFIR